MDTLVDTLISSPWLLKGLALVIFAIALVFIFKRLAGFAITIILIVAALGSGYTIFNYDQVSSYLREQYESFTGRELPMRANGEQGADIGEMAGDMMDQVKGWFQSDSSSKTENNGPERTQ